MKNTPEILADRIKRHRLKAGLKRKHLADLAGVESVSICRLEAPVDKHGHPRGFRISLRTVMRIAHALGLELTDLTGKTWRD